MINDTALPTQATADTESPVSGAMWKTRLDRAKVERKKRTRDWKVNIDYRRGKPFASESDEDRIAVNIDWPLTKAKHASLFSQVPAVTATSDLAALKPVAGLFARALNKHLAKAKVDVAMDEVMPDVINAAGIGAVIVGYQTLTEKRQIAATAPPPAPAMPGMPADPSAPPMPGAPPVAGMPPDPMATPPPMEEIDFPVSKRFYARRISPADLLTPDEFIGSDFDEANWIGESGRMLWAQAQAEFGLKDEQREKVVGNDFRNDMEKQHVSESDKQDAPDADTVTYDQIFYWRHRYDPLMKHFDCIYRLVFVTGIQEPVIDEQWAGQGLSADGSKYLGVHQFPIRVCTLTYLTDESIPPSDSAIGRPQVNELIASRTEMVLQRKRSTPMRWVDVSRVDPMVLDTIMKGEYQGIIPVIGNGDKAIGEVARAVMARESFEFDRVAKADLQEMWRLGPNQLGQFATGERSAAEAKSVQSGFASGAGMERARVGKFFVGIATVLAGLVARFDDFADILSPEETQAIDQAWPKEVRDTEFMFNIRPDSTVLLDTQQRIEQLVQAINLSGKSPYINAKPMYEEYLTLTGMDLATSLVDPQPPKPEPAAISMRLSGAIDLLNPMVLAFLIKSNQAPSPEDLQAAKVMLQAVGPAAMPPPAPPAAPTGPVGLTEPQRDGWTAGIDRVNKRTDEAN